MPQYRVVSFQQYRTMEPVPRFDNFSAANDDEAIGKASRMVTPVAERYGVSLKGVVRLRDGKPTTIIFEDGRRVLKRIRTKKRR